MATKKTTERKKIDYKNWVWCIDNLSKDQMKAFDENPPSPDEIIDGMHKMIEKGFKVTVKSDNYTGNLIVTAVCDETGYDNSGLAISARSDDTEDMIGILLYKFFVVAEGDLRPFADEKPKGVRG